MREPVMLPLGCGLFLRCFDDGSCRICEKNGGFPDSEVQGNKARKRAKNKELVKDFRYHYCGTLTKLGKAMANLLQ